MIAVVETQETREDKCVHLSLETGRGKMGMGRNTSKEEDDPRVDSQKLTGERKAKQRWKGG